MVQKNGGIRIELRTEEHVSLLLKADIPRLKIFGAQAHAHLALGPTKERKVVLVGVPAEITDDSLRRAFAAVGRPVDQLDRCTYTATSNVFVVLMSKAHAKEAIDERRLYLEDEHFRLRVEKPKVKRVAEVLCFRCSTYGHFQHSCTSLRPKCGHCAGQHLRRTCPKREDPTAAKCANCDKPHPAGSRGCIARVEARDRSAAEERRRNARRQQPTPQRQTPPRTNAWAAHQQQQHQRRMEPHRQSAAPEATRHEVDFETLKWLHREVLTLQRKGNHEGATALMELAERVGLTAPSNSGAACASASAHIAVMCQQPEARTTSAATSQAGPV